MRFMAHQHDSAVAIIRMCTTWTAASHIWRRMGNSYDLCVWLISLVGDTYVVIVIRPLICVGCPLSQEAQAYKDCWHAERHRKKGCQTTRPWQTYWPGDQHYEDPDTASLGPHDRDGPSSNELVTNLITEVLSMGCWEHDKGVNHKGSACGHRRLTWNKGVCFLLSIMEGLMRAAGCRTYQLLSQRHPR